MKPSTTARDFFLHLLHMVALYASAIAALSTLWQMINLRFPDPTEGLYRYYAINSAIRWGVAVLIIMFPVLLGTAKFLGGAYKKDPEKKELKIRKWLIYLTLFITALIVIIDLVRLIFEFLQGEITPRFILKFASVLAVAFAVFWYYLQGVRESKWKILGCKAEKIFAWKVIIIAIAIIVGGVLVVDSPKEEQAYRRDETRVQHFQTLENLILNYWREHQMLPGTLDDLEIVEKDEAWSPLRDPQTNVPYAYEKQAENTFALCAEFEKETRGRGVETPYEGRPLPLRLDRALEVEYEIKGTSWNHPASEHCFKREIVKREK